MKRLLSAAVLMLACVRVPGSAGGGCVTPCGMTSTEIDCESLQRYETRAVRQLALHVLAFREERICRALRGWRVEIHHHDPVLDKACGANGWELFKGFCAGGYTHADTRVIELGSADMTKAPLVHELAHVADYDLTGKVGHCRWSDPGLLQVMEDMIGEPELSRPGRDCSPDAGR